jgi:predicted nucleic acid-binding protein
VRLFLDTSVLLAAAASNRGASREIFRLAPGNEWVIITTGYVVEEVLRNLPDFSPLASGEWVRLRSELLLMEDVITLDRPAVFSARKDRPILFSAFAWADILLTLDSADFGHLLGASFYGMPVLRPGQFLHRERTAGRLREPP